MAGRPFQSSLHLQCAYLKESHMELRFFPGLHYHMIPHLKHFSKKRHLSLGHSCKPHQTRFHLVTHLCTVDSGVIDDVVVHRFLELNIFLLHPFAFSSLVKFHVPTEPLPWQPILRLIFFLALTTLFSSMQASVSRPAHPHVRTALVSIIKNQIFQRFLRILLQIGLVHDCLIGFPSFDFKWDAFALVLRA